MTEVEIEAYDKQLDFLSLDTRYRAFIGGVGSGKTTAGCLFCLQQAIQKPNTLGVVATKTYNMLRDVIIRSFLEICPDRVIQDFNKMEKRIELKNGSEILFRPLNREKQIDKLRGLTINWAWIDEAAYVDEYAFEVLQARMRQGENQCLAVTTTPAGKNWIYERFIEENKEEYSAVEGVTSMQNPYLPRRYVDDLREEYSEEYLRQEVFAEFVKFKGLVYKEFKRKEHLLSREEVKDLDFKDYVFGYDAGYRNPRVLLKIGKTVNDKYVVLDEFYRSEVNLSEAIQTFKERYLIGDRCKVFADPSAKGEIEEMKSQGIYAKGADNEVNAGIQKIKELFSNKYLFVSEKCTNTLEELDSYRWNDDESKDKPVKSKDKPVKENDHAMDALRYALYSSETGGDFGYVSFDV